MQKALSADNGRVLEWNYSDVHSEKWKWWCHGGPGIALAFLNLYEQTGKDSYADVVTKALEIHPFDIQYPNLSQCHGISGLGEIYLEAYSELFLCCAT